MLKKLFSHSLIYGLAPQVSKIASIFVLPIITRDLTAVDFGVWGILMAYTGALEALSHLGLNVVLSNSFFKMPAQYKWLWRQIYGFLMVWMIPYALLLGGILYAVMPVEAQDHALLLTGLIVAPKVFFGPTGIMGTFYYQLQQRPLPIVIRTVIFGFLTVGLHLYTISYLKLGYLGWAWTEFIVMLLLNASYWYVINRKLGYRPIFNFKWRTIRQSLKVALPTVPHAYSAFLLDSSDRIVMDQLQVGTAAMGQYDLAARFGGYFRTLIQSVNKAIMPMLLQCYKEKRDEAARTIIFTVQVGMLGATFTYSIWSREVFQFLIANESLAQVYPLSIIIVMAFNYRPMYSGALSKLFYTEQTHLLWRVSFIAGAGNVLLNFALIPFFGFEAAAYATFASLMYMGFSGHFMPKTKACLSANFYPAFWLTVIVAMTALAYGVVALSIGWKVVITLALGLSILGIGWSFRKELKGVNG